MARREAILDRRLRLRYAARRRLRTQRQPDEGCAQGNAEELSSR